MSKDKPKQVFHGRRQLNDWLKFPLKKMQQKRGFAEGRLLTDWPQIVGAALSAHCVPQKLSFPKGQNGATLHILCEAGWAMELQFQEQLICEKIASFFGYRAVDRIRIHQGVLPARASKNIPKPVAPNPDHIADEVATVEDPELQAALNRLALSRKDVAKLETNRKQDDIKT